ncbi:MULTISPECIES: NUDIX hydrolase [Acinetobacter]|jgi:8-oxo-dGTP diphosphatase|uniref:NUDIX domain-containing protein n=1 Tax=Acinetobacter chengduensis TaxID=2420890 RepID=A0ABX9TT64_9GAMM|nr:MULTISPECIES: NUDIX domain-containing protein [Acinetobacter]MBI1451760.1 NUDIX domain-containing protein [Acinetobacter sp. FL51]RKG44098.1 NUDIX domain-containing protein [Acinetobacter sp. WCHAc060007]RLL19586.1 NUDIX domain-containing protein [Acinetobacter chengduensis]
MKVITVAAGIVLNEQQQMLVVRKKNTACFMQVGGKLEPNELPAQTIVREIAEEIGCQANIQHYLGRFETATANEPDHQLVSYVYHVTLDQIPTVHAEIAEMRWVDLDDNETPLAPLTTQIIIPWIKQQLVSSVTS